MPTWGTVDGLLDFFAGLLGKDAPEDLPAFWENLAPVALDAAEADLRAALAARGYTAAQVATLSGAHSLVTMQGAFYLGVLGAAHLPDEYGIEAVKLLDQRERWADKSLMLPVVLDEEGILVPPALVGRGTLRNNSMFTERGTVERDGGQTWKRY